ncbi:DNA-binding transcriptional regulator, GntR family [Polaromonas sp. OV174]|uniref:GntR family transcriptional regulator n=1 Tax=Polaromonas sp. OV174 TaxID=1855300 RepID=UPI0008ED49AC|nr:GntR family transcriptional regulator [Polaromonas sp. OV174]SFB83674.1 DNA-binding transcriptional regulator, GntR family [Polaromonas sp. OV174]
MTPTLARSNSKSQASGQLDLGGPIGLHTGLPIRHQVEQRLKERIQNVTLLPGTPLPENELAQQLEVSRTPVREALQRLTHEGLIQVVPQVGTFVARIDLDRVKEALFVREAVECTALTNISTRLSKDDMAALKRLVEMHQAAVEKNDTEATLRADEAFHRYLLALGGVPGAWRYVQEAREMHRRVRILTQTSAADGARRSVAQHASILKRLAQGKLPEAADLLREHVRMNFEMAKELARSHPDYFVASSIATLPGTNA